MKLFKDNMPGKEWVVSFLSCHKEQLLRPCIRESIKRARAGVTPEVINSFFDNVTVTDTLTDVPLSNIMNYDETNLTDDPGRKRVIVIKGYKHPERVMNSSKSSVSDQSSQCSQCLTRGIMEVEELKDDP